MTTRTKSGADLPAPTSQELQDFANTRGFAFEMQVLAQLRSLQFQCDHAGSYVDPVSGKIRAFDIRARQRFGNQDFELRLAVECKSIRAASPIVIHATPRQNKEANLSVLVHHDRYGLGIVQGAKELGVASSLYAVDKPVGRALEQYTTSKNDERDIHDRWLQAINGAAGVIRHAIFDSLPLPSVIAVVPMLVVPDGRLCQIDYGDGGDVVTPARPVAASTWYMRHTWEQQTKNGSSLRVHISHLEIATPAGLQARLHEFRVEGERLADAALDR